MLKDNIRKGRFISLFLCLSIILTGCQENANVLLNTQISVPADLEESRNSQLYRQEYLSQDICVIPKKNRSVTDSAITAQAALLVNDTDNKMLFAQNIYDKMYPASITKIVTALLVLEQGNLEDTVTVSYDASHITEYGAKLCGFQEGDKISLKDLLYCLLVYSGNDAGIAIAEHMAGSVSAFSDLMNQEMTRLGASGTHFVNPHGLHDSKHYTTAYDLYLIFHELLKYDLFCEIIQQANYTASWVNVNGEPKELTFQSTDRYLLGSVQTPKGLTVVGGKTGTTIDAGSCLILYSRDKKKKDYISVILKAESSASLYTQMNHLLEYVKRG